MLRTIAIIGGGFSGTVLASFLLLRPPLLTSFIQALVFTLLSTIYILLWLPHEHHAEEGHAHH